jgi:hypothetical protein
VTPELGWYGFYLKYVLPAIDQGIKTIWLHNPMGREGLRNLNSYGLRFDSDYRFDEYLAACTAQLDWLTFGFGPSTKQLVQSNGTRVIVYLGTLLGQYEFNYIGRGQQEIYLDRVTRALEPFLFAGCDISIDSSSLTPKDSHEHLLMQLLKARGINVIIESVPQKTHDHLKSWDMVCGEDHWENVIGDTQGVYYHPVSEYGGRIYRGLWIARPPEYATQTQWLQTTVPLILNEGQKYSAIVNITHYLNDGGKVADLITGVST